MPEQKSNTTRRETLIEKIIRRSLETIGGSVDRLFGRGRKPNALPDTADLGERLRKLIDARAQTNQTGRKLAPHFIRLKYAWGQASDEFLSALKRLENELLIVAIDHINDNRYTTVAPVKISSKADILTEGFALSLGFDEADLNESEAVAVPIEIYAQLLPQTEIANQSAPQREVVITANANFPNGKERRTKLTAAWGEKTSFVVGRIKETDLYLDDPSVSKHHASLVFTADGKLRVADIGSTNGTSVNNERIAYGKAYEVELNQTVGFGDVRVCFDWELPQIEASAEQSNSNDAPTPFETAPAAPAIKVGGVSQNQPDLANSKTEAHNDFNRSEQATTDEPTIIGGERDRYKTFIDDRINNEYQTFVNDDANDRYRTFVGEEVNDRYKTFIDDKISAANIGDEVASNNEQKDFTQSLSNKKIDSND